MRWLYVKKGKNNITIKPTIWMIIIIIKFLASCREGCYSNASTCDKIPLFFFFFSWVVTTFPLLYIYIPFTQTIYSKPLIDTFYKSPSSSLPLYSLLYWKIKTLETLGFGQSNMVRFILLAVWSLSLGLSLYPYIASAQLKQNYYANICPNVENIVKTVVQKKFQQTFVTVPATLRLFFHDCLVQVTQKQRAVFIKSNHPHSISIFVFCCWSHRYI